ncbi:hypothetical protein [Candidatus Nitrotoga fabula]|uniref:Uncharacterized protein n=1 Tax=Candidatus Nitrotoga fabula TaxID=2182327 RepID=A0A916BFE8_9PROT|nr:hypothetical protein [Candidatus Nitrotoga fabula]CAE6702537.1 hypothetical protein NTGZN8_160004 [Candidatus Nitrotoga fabula]
MLAIIGKSKKKKDAEISTKKGILQYAGHAWKQITKGYYFSLGDDKQVAKKWLKSNPMLGNLKGYKNDSH